MKGKREGIERMAEKYELGVIGLGVMGRGLAENAAEHGHRVVGLDRDPDKVRALQSGPGPGTVRGAERLGQFVELLDRPRAVMMLIPAGDPVDEAIAEIEGLLDEGDVLMDAGNSHFADTDRRAAGLTEHGVRYFGVGVSGGAEGARHGASIMPGGPRDDYGRIEPILTSLAAEAGGSRCVTYLGEGSAGHYVKMVHNGIEYGLMQLIAEAYDLMRRGLELSIREIQEVFSSWSTGRLGGYLIEITAQVLGRRDDRTDDMLIDRILDAAGQKGTGKWTSQEAMNLGVPIPTIDAAVAMRNLSAHAELRAAANHGQPGPPVGHPSERSGFTDRLGRSLLGAMILTYDQGFALLRSASQAHGYELELGDVARIWRGGCIIRSELLASVEAAYGREPGLATLLADPDLSGTVADSQTDLRQIVASAARWAVPVPALAATLASYDALRSRRLPANLLQAQRDFFGAHGYERIDAPGTFHADWTGSGGRGDAAAR